MSSQIAALALAGCLAMSTVVAAQPEAAPAKLPIRRVVLYKHGVGYFERQGAVEGNATVSLRFQADDMSDLLKSLTVFDLNGGRIGTIAYDSTKTVEQQLAEYAFDLQKAQSLPAVLEQMKGSQVILSVAGREMTGRVLAIEKRLERRDTAVVETWRLSVLLEGGAVKNYGLDEIEQIRFADPRLQQELENYLKILFSRHRRDEKEVVIQAHGKGARQVFMAYVQSQPVWKVSYRVVLDPKEKSLLQAWAVVDNVSQEDWQDVSLSLVSGLPVSFQMNLYEPWYMQRPMVQMQRETVGPVAYEAGEMMQERPAMRAREMAKDESFRKADAVGRGAGAMAMPPAPPPMLQNMAQQAAVAVAQSAGALFRYDVAEPVTIGRDRSALLPIASSAIDATRVSIYNESTRQDNPMVGIRLKNSTGLTLEGGPVTVIEEDTYAGDALLDTFKPGEERYLSFAVDLGTRVNSKLGGMSQTIHRVRIVRGTMFMEHKQQQTKTYALVNVEPKEKRVVVEHPVRAGWSLVPAKDAKPIEITPQHYRFEVKLPADGKAPLEVTEEMPGESSVAITNISRDQIVVYLRQKYIDEKTRIFLEKVADAQAVIASLKRDLQQASREREQITQNQARVRQNMSGLGQSEQERTLRARYVKQLDTEEDRLQELVKREKDLAASIEEKQKALDDMVSGFTFETKV